MINSVRNTVLSVVNKNNYGYISPSDFNLYALQAQLEIFEEYFDEYNTLVNKENARVSGTGYADLKKSVEEMIDIFSVTKYFSHSAANTYSLPSLITTGDDYFTINKLLCYPVILAEGQNTSFILNSLEDATATFVTDGVAVGDIVANLSTGTQATVVTVVSETVLLLSANIFPVFFDQSQPDYQDFELPIEDEYKLVQKILQYVGISIREAEVYQFAKVEEREQQQQ